MLWVCKKFFQDQGNTAHVESCSSDAPVFFFRLFFGFFPVFLKWKNKKTGFLFFSGFFIEEQYHTNYQVFGRLRRASIVYLWIVSTPAAGYYSTPNMFRRLRRASIAHLTFFNACDGLLYYDTPKILRRLRRASIVQNFFDVCVLLLWYTENFLAPAAGFYSTSEFIDACDNGVLWFT